MDIKKHTEVYSVVLDYAFILAPAILIAKGFWIIGLIALIVLCVIYFKLPSYQKYRAKVRGFTVFLIVVNTVAIAAVVLNYFSSTASFVAGIIFAFIVLICFFPLYSGMTNAREESRSEEQR